MYGMGKNKLALSLGVSKDEADKLIVKYNRKVPFVKLLSDRCKFSADEKGVIRTKKGRKCRFDLWEPRAFGIHKALPLWEAEKEYGRDLKRAWTYKALNRLIQGSAADQTKKAMLELYKQGYMAHIQVHDELDFSVANEQDKNNIKEIMEQAIKLEVPTK